MLTFSLCIYVEALHTQIQSPCVTWGSEGTLSGSLSIIKQMQSTWCSSLTLLYLVSTQSYLWQSTKIRQIAVMVKNLKDREAGIFIRKEHLERHYIFECERMREKGACMSQPSWWSHAGPQRVSILLFVHSFPDTSKKHFNSAHAKLQYFQIKQKAGERKKKWERLYMALNYLTFQLNARGIKPGVKPTLLFRLDATKQKAIWQTVR